MSAEGCCWGISSEGSRHLTAKVFALYTSHVDVGGVESVYCLIAQGLIDRGWQVDMLTRAGGELYENRIPQGARAVMIGRLGIPSLLRYLASRKPDYLMSAKLDCNVELLACKALYHGKTRAVIRYDGVLDAYYLPGPVPKVRRAVGRFMLRCLLRESHAAIAVSDGMMAAARKAFPHQGRRLHRLYNPIDTGRILELAREPCDHPWIASGMRGGVPVVLHVGRLAREKDVPTLLRAFALARRERELRLVIVGIGPEAANLKRQANSLGIAESVSFVGHVENQYAYMAGAQVFAMSSVAEGLGCVLQEAMACSASIVCTDYTFGARELLAEGEYGVLVPMSDPGALAKGILAALDHPIDPDALKERASDFDIDSHIDELLSILGESTA